MELPQINYKKLMSLASEAPAKISWISFSFLMVIGRKGDWRIILLGACVDCPQGSFVDFECALKALVW
jgi:hypothetical protein